MEIFRYIVDIAYIVSAIAIVVIFTARGFFESVFRFGRYIAALMISWFCGPMLSDYLYDKWIYGWIADPLYQKISAFLSNTVGSVDVEELIESLPGLVRRFVDVEAMETKYGNTLSSIDGAALDFADAVAQPPASLISNLIAYVAIYFLALLVLTLVFKLMNRVFDIPVLSAINRFLGALLGILTAFFVLSAVTWLIGALAGLFGGGERLSALAEGSRLFGFFQNLQFFKLFE